jgi:hypothetical protein
VDFDGVIHSYLSPWSGPAIISDPPVEGAIAFLLDAMKHFHVSIYSSRSADPLGVAAMQAWLKKHAGATWYASPDGPGLEDIDFPTQKPAAFLTIDDRAFLFTGEFPEPAKLLSFKPWNKR